MSAERILRVARDERLARLAGFSWGFAEGVFFFIVPDVYVTFAALFSWRAGAVAWVASIAGSLTGVAVIYLTVALGVDYVPFLTSIPGISQRMLFTVGAQVGAQGLPYTPFLILGGVPLKVYAGVATTVGIGLVSMVVWTVFARVVRIAPTFVLVVATRLLFRRSIDTRPWVWCAVLVCVWVAFYVFYFVHMSRA